MPKRKDIESVLIIGAGPIIIGQACEFDYSGAQACKALREEGLRVILINSNPATIMTDPEMADSTYIEPITWKIVEKIIEIEKPDALLPTMGGQVALNCSLDLVKQGVLEKHNVKLIGASKKAIDTAEDRELFKKAMNEIGLESARSALAHSLKDALQIQKEIGYPCIIRPSFTMGGSGGGIAYNQEEFKQICTRGLEISPTQELLIEESLIGWKEYEMEVVRDNNDNVIIICSIENLDPMGIHTGDSITVAPALTLTDKEYQIMRNASIAVLRKVGVETGGSNVQFAVNPKNGRMIIIEMNPRVSRSSALASKATGFPIAKIAAKLAIGFTLDELKNEITGGLTPSSFEPTIDYIVTKIPRFAFEKFTEADDILTTQMKSVGEVMAIGRTFKESIQKALRGLETGLSGFDRQSSDKEKIISELRIPGSNRILFLADGIHQGISAQELHNLSNIDPWFIAQIQEIIDEEKALQKKGIKYLDANKLREIKKLGFSDMMIASLVGESETNIRKLRHQLNILPVYKRVDTCAAEFSTPTAYLYSSYDSKCEAKPTDKKKIVILGGGPNRIGQGIEFDYCCVHAAFALKEEGFETIMINCNPETVSTDYDTSDRLYFEPLTVEDVLEVVDKEKPWGVIVQFGGQTPLKLAMQLQKEKIPIIGTSPEMIDIAEDREHFQAMLNNLGLKQPENAIARTIDEAISKARKIMYPIIVRPSYVLGGRAMKIVYNQDELAKYMKDAITVTKDSPVLLDRFLSEAVEVDVDAISDGNRVVIAGVMQHIEQAGIHSGDSACVIPPFSLSTKMLNTINEQTIKMSKALEVVGLMNVQFAIQDENIYVLEVNPRASRTVPFVSKAIGLPIAAIAAKCMAGISLDQQNIKYISPPELISIKEVVFPFNKFPNVDPVLGPEMKSTGEVMGIAKTFSEAFLKSQIATNTKLPKAGKIFISVRDSDKPKIVDSANQLFQTGFSIVATLNTAKYLNEKNIKASVINKMSEGRPHIVDMIKNNEIVMVINTADEKLQTTLESKSIRSIALSNNIPIFTTAEGAIAACNAIMFSEDITPISIQKFH